jgi:hypothetical protein
MMKEGSGFSIEGSGSPAESSHDVSLAIWDVPSPVIVGGRFAMKVGAKCGDGCVLSDRRIEIRDEGGIIVASGILGALPWEGTTGLYWTIVGAEAPAHPGIYSWSVAIAATGSETLHEAGTRAALSFAAVPHPDRAALIKVVDKLTKSPVADAQVRLGVYRASTDAHGIAKLAVSGRRHTLFVWKAGYEPPTLEVDATGDGLLEVQMAPLPEENPDARWRG